MEDNTRSVRNLFKSKKVGDHMSLAEIRTKNILKAIGVKPVLNGYYYWPAAVEEATKRGETNYKICGDIYEAVAEKYKTTPSRVERCMRTVTAGCQVRIQKYFDVRLDKITNKEFLALVMEKIKRGGNYK